MHELGFNILAVDLRGHGDSGGLFSTGGYFERDDVNQVIDQARAQQPVQSQQIVLFGISLGAAVAAGVAALRDDIAAVVLESPFPSYEQVVANHTRIMNLPDGITLKSAIMCAQKLSGAKFGEVRVVDLLIQIRCPVLTIVGTDDVLLNDADIDAMEAATLVKAGNVFWKVQNAGHLQAMVQDPIEYRRQLESFFHLTH